MTLLQNIRSLAGPTLLAVSTIVGFGILFPPSAYAGSKGVVELYTSQGCSSCPPADRLAAQLAQDPELVVLTLPVTYWDYLGWKDTFAKKEFTNRQYAYAKLRGDRSVYTPQVVINGFDHTVGSDEKTIKKMLGSRNLPVDVTIAANADDLSIKVAGDSKGREAVVWLALFQSEGTVAIGRGENRNRTVTYTNIVREMRPLGKWTGKEMSVDLPKSEVMKDKITGVAVIVQTKKGKLPAHILGAASWTDKSSS
ncbi:MAG: DUF1223 domain-containing protein [Pseudomonadota bacterium]